MSQSGCVGLDEKCRDDFRLLRPALRLELGAEIFENLHCSLFVDFSGRFVQWVAVEVQRGQALELADLRRQARQAVAAEVQRGQALELADLRRQARPAV